MESALQADSDMFITDVCKRKGDSWRMATRYAAGSSRGKAVIPGSVLDTAIEKKY